VWTTAAIVAASPGVIVPPASAAVTEFIATLLIRRASMSRPPIQSASAIALLASRTTSR
jgi:hypothetical protein